MNQRNKRIYQGLVVSIENYDDDLIRTSTALEQSETAISWNEKWSESWES